MQVPFAYRIRSTRRSRYMRMTVHETGDVVVSVPRVFDALAVERFVAKHADWVLRVLDKMKRRAAAIGLPGGRADYLAKREAARRLICAEVDRCNQWYGFSYARISIRNQKGCWGSCSRRQNLNFNYRLIYLPPELREYVIVHELCHLLVFGHGKLFWDEVGRAVPDWRERRKALRRYRLR